MVTQMAISGKNHNCSASSSLILPTNTQLRVARLTVPLAHGRRHQHATCWFNRTSDFRWLLREGYGIELETVPHETVTEPTGDLGLQPLDLGASKLHHLARIQVDEVVMVLLRRFLVTSSAVAERVSL